MTAPLALTEQAFTDQVIEYAQLRGWLVHHDRPARTNTGWRTAIHGNRGFPDLILVRGHVIAAELKVGRGKPTSEQRAWLLAFQHAGVLTFLWHPACWHQIEDVLR